MGRMEEGEAVECYRARYSLACWSEGKIGRMEERKDGRRENGGQRGRMGSCLNHGLRGLSGLHGGESVGRSSSWGMCYRARVGLGVGASKGNRGRGREINLTSVGFHSVFDLSGRDGVSVSGVVRVGVLVEIRSTQPTW